MIMFIGAFSCFARVDAMVYSRHCKHLIQKDLNLLTARRASVRIADKRDTKQEIIKMAYRRSWRGNSNWNDNKRVHVTLAWNTLVGAYDLKFDQIYGDEKWGKVKGIIAWIKMTIPYGERDYDDQAKIWTIHEKYFTQLRDILNTMGSEFSVTCVEKPLGGPAIKFTPIDVYFDIFKSATGIDIKTLREDEFPQAKRIYFKAAMQLHPDRGGDPALMRDFNEAWDVLKERHFKQVKIMEQVQ